MWQAIAWFVAAASFLGIYSACVVFWWSIAKELLERDGVWNWIALFTSVGVASSGAVLAYWIVMRLVPARQKPAGVCVSCGYDLRGSPGPTCPECGAERAHGAQQDKPAKPEASKPRVHKSAR